MNKITLFNVDVAFLIDATGSMGSLIRACTDKIYKIATHLKKAYPLANFRFALVAYRDFDEANQYEVYDFSENITELHGHLQKLTACGGNDEAEDVLGGLQKVVELTWSNDSVHVMAHFADAPGHGVKFNGGAGDNHPKYDDDEKLHTKTLNDLYKLNVQYKFFNLGGNTKFMIQKFSQLFTDSTVNTGFTIDTIDINRNMNLILSGVVNCVSNSINDVLLNNKGALSHLSSGHATLDLFIKTVRGISTEVLYQLLDKSWEESPSDTLKIIFNGRDCREGKGERALFASAMKWLISNHLESFYKNMDLIVTEYGRWADLLEFIDDPVVGDKIAARFAEQLKKDLEDMEAGKPISLCAKWAPTEKGKFDKKSKAVKRIAIALGVNKQQYRKKYTTPLREYLKVVERYMTLKEWNKIDYSRVPAVAMNNLKKAFEKHDKTRFDAFLEAVKKGDKKINVATLQPHDILKSYIDKNSEDNAVTEQQWKTFVNKIEKMGSLHDAVVVVDVSESMQGEPLQVAVSLGLLISELSAEPFKNNVISFSENPTFHSLAGLTLREKVQLIAQLSCDDSTSLSGVFDALLEKAKQSGTEREDFPSTIYVLSDMQFEQADATFRTNHEIYKERFANEGYSMPRIIYWNIKGGSEGFETKSDEQSVSLVSGFSTSIFKQLIESYHEQTPYDIMRMILDAPRYSKIAV
jgi:hypothetical protein